MIQSVLLRIRMDFNGNRLGEPEIIKILPDDAQGCLKKTARIYARMIQNDLINNEDKGGQKKSEVQKSERKSYQV